MFIKQTLLVELKKIMTEEKSWVVSEWNFLSNERYY